MGLPVVATDIRGCRQVVTHGDNGLLVPVGDVAALETAIAGLVIAPGRRATMGAAGRRKAEREFDERDVVRRVLACYAEVADRKRITPLLAPPALTVRIQSIVADKPSSSGVAVTSGKRSRNLLPSACECATSPARRGWC